MRSFTDHHVLLIGKEQTETHRVALLAGVAAIELQIDQLDDLCDWNHPYDVGEVPAYILERREKRQALIAHKAILHSFFIALDK